MLVIGHRGAAGVAPENTLESLRAGVAAGADILEFDVRLTKDNVPVIIHDASTQRTHKTRKVISSLTFKELQALHLTPHIPTLEEVLNEFFGHIMLNIELKARGSGEAVTKLLAARYVKQDSDWDAVIISSFKARELLKARKISATIPLALLHDQNPFLFIGYERRLRFSAVGFHRLYVNPLATEIAKRLGLFCYAYTVDRPYGALLLERKGIDGVVTNLPRTILTDINKQKERP